MRDRVRKASTVFEGRGRAFKRLLVRVVELECRLAAAWAAGAHSRLLAVEYRLPPAPPSFDHQIDLYSLWQKSRDPGWIERGAFSSLCLKGGSVLELTCGDGFITRNFYSFKSTAVLACDVDPSAIEKARRKNSAPNIEYVVVDIKNGLPQGTFDNVVWDFGFPFSEYFSDEELRSIFDRARDRLTAGGVMSGHTTVDINALRSDLRDRTFVKNALERILRERFGNVVIFATTSPTRVYLYFWASDGALPLDPDWSHEPPSTEGGRVDVIA
jgi:SAM-dependent methyltransferase